VKAYQQMHLAGLLNETEVMMLMMLMLMLMLMLMPMMMGLHRQM
jgi:hypothetical protein